MLQCLSQWHRDSSWAVLDRGDTLVQSDVVLALQPANPFPKDSWVLLDELLGREWTWLINCVHWGTSGLRLVQFIVVQVGHYLHTQTSLPPQQGADIRAINQLAVEQTAVVTTPHKQENSADYWQCRTPIGCDFHAR